MVLFTGAGFSAEARARDGRPIPTGEELADELWTLCFPGEARDGSTLQDLFHHALSHERPRLERLLESRLKVDPRTLPSHYRLWLAAPWRRVYTLNVDDLARAAESRFALGRTIELVSALRGGCEPAPPSPGRLQVVHLNGSIDDGVDRITFSTTQYGARLATRCPGYASLMRDFDEHPTLFVGTRLDEAPFFQHLELSGMAGARGRHPPPSYVVTKHLSRARRSLLEGLHVTWLPMSEADFAHLVLAEADAAHGAHHAT